MRVRFTLVASLELDDVLMAIERRSPTGAAKVKARIQEMIALLVDQPRLGNLTSKKDVRRLVVYPFPYLIFYRVTAIEIIIVSIRHGARRPRKSSN